MQLQEEQQEIIQQLKEENKAIKSIICRNNPQEEICQQPDPAKPQQTASPAQILQKS